MKKLLLFPGNSARNKEWLHAAGEYYVNSGWFDQVYLHEYDHWQTGDEEINFERELEKLQAAVALDACVTLVVFAKSVGSLLALMAIDRAIILPSHCVFFGMPLELAAGGVFVDNWSPLKNLSVPTIAFHNDEDPISYKFTKQALTEHAPQIHLITRQGDNHSYTEFPEFDTKIETLLFT